MTYTIEQLQTPSVPATDELDQLRGPITVLEQRNQVSDKLADAIRERDAYKIGCDVAKEYVALLEHDRDDARRERDDLAAKLGALRLVLKGILE